MRDPIRRLTCAALAFALAVAAAACSAAARRTGTSTPSGGEERAVVAAAERMFTGMRTRDTALLRAMLSPDLVVVAVRETADTATVRHQRVPDFLRGVANGREELRERIWSPEVRVDGPVATLWAPYDFHRGDTFSHCGYDAFQFARIGASWVVTGLTYTVRSSPCPGPPGGGAGGSAAPGR